MDMNEKELQEKLKNMSPEELKEFQKQQCIFCQMVTGKVQSKKIYEDDRVLAILDINPANPGHILLMPKEHYMILPQMPPGELEYIFNVAKNLSHVLLRALGVEGTNIFVANGVAAGQRAQHFMIHIIPRMEGDNVVLEIPRNDADEVMMDTVQRSLIEAIEKTTGAKAPEIVDRPYEDDDESDAEPQEQVEEKIVDEKESEENNIEEEQDVKEESASKEEVIEEVEPEPEEKSQDEAEKEVESQEEAEPEPEDVKEESDADEEPKSEKEPDENDGLEEKAREQLDELDEKDESKKEEEDDLEDKKPNLDIISDALFK